MERGEREGAITEFSRGFQAALHSRGAEGSSKVPLVVGGGVLVVVALGLLAVVLPVLLGLVLAVFIATVVYGAAEGGARGARGLVVRGRSFDSCPPPRRAAIASRRGASGLEQILLDALMTGYRRAHGALPPPDLTEQEAMELRLGYLAPALAQKALGMLVMQQVGTPLHRMFVDGHEVACEWAAKVAELQQPRRRNFWLTQRWFAVLSLGKFGLTKKEVFAKDTVEDLARDPAKFRRFLWNVLGSSHVLALEELLSDALPPPPELVLEPAPAGAETARPRPKPPATTRSGVGTPADDPEEMAVELVDRVQRELDCDSELWGDGAEPFLSQAREALERVALPHHPRPQAVEGLMATIDQALSRVSSFDGVFEAIMDRPDGCWPEWLGDAIRAATDSPAYQHVEAAWPLVERNARRLYCTMANEPDAPRSDVDEQDDNRESAGGVNGSDVLADNDDATRVTSITPHDAAQDLGF